MQITVVIATSENKLQQVHKLNKTAQRYSNKAKVTAFK
jgi:hypothetical protein